MITFSREHPVNMWDEAIPLFVRHHKEISLHKDFKVKPDFPMYLRAEEGGALRVYTARKDGALVGYAVFFLRVNSHFRNCEAVQDLLFIDKPVRGFGVKFLKWCDLQLEKDGVNVVYHHVNAHHDFSPILIRQGYELCDYVYAKRLT